ncbi:MAG: tetratricopeptide repeat protein [Chloroflexota bacterium]
MSDILAQLSQQVVAAQSQEEKTDALNALAWATLPVDRTQAQQQSETAWQLAAACDPPYQRGLAESNRTLSRIFLYNGELDHAITTALEALAQLEALDYRTPMPQVLHTIASCYRTLGNLSEGLQYHLRQLTVSEEVGDKEGYALALLGMGSVYTDNGDYKSALERTEKSLAAFAEIDLPYWSALAMNNLSYIYLRIGNHAQAIQLGETCLERCRQLQNTRVTIIASHTMAEVYLDMGDTEQALTYLQAAVELAHEASFRDMEIEALKLSGDVYRRRNQMEKGIDLLTQAATLAEANSYRKFLYESYQLLAEAYKAQGNFEQALRYFELYHTIRDTVLGDEGAQRLKTLEALHQTEAARKEASLYASLYEEEQARRLLAETLHQVSVALSSTLELKAVLHQILEQLALLVPYDRASLLLREGDHLEFVAMSGFPDGEKVSNVTVPLNQSRPDDVFLRIYDSKQPLALEHLATYPGWHQVANLAIPEAWLGVPLLRHDKVIGMLSLAREEAIPYSEDAITVAMAFAAQAAVALENARLYDYARRFTEQLEYEVRNRTEALRAAYEQLERLDRAKTDFITVTAHELRTPITVLKGYAQLLLKDELITDSPHHSRLVSSMVTGANRLHKIVNTMLLLVKIDNRELRPFLEPVIISDVLRKVVTELSSDLELRRLTLSLQNLDVLPEVAADSELLPAVFESVLVNAIKYTPDGGQIVINGRFWTESPAADLPPNSVEIIVHDTGIGIDAEALELIFTKFYQTGDVSLHSSGKTRFKAGGPGLGLAIAKGIIEAHRGLIWAESPGYDEAALPGSTFHIVLPLRYPNNKS